jgi:transcriptional regulator with XRE-family HTH domain
MSTTLKDKIAQLPPDHQAGIRTEAERLRAEYPTLRDLRRARDLTRAQLAETLGQKQVSIARLEKRTDLLLSTLRRYVEAMGGTLSLVVAFPDRAPVRLDGLGEVDEPPRRRPEPGGAGARQ